MDAGSTNGERMSAWRELLKAPGGDSFDSGSILTGGSQGRFFQWCVGRQDKCLQRSQVHQVV